MPALKMRFTIPVRFPVTALSARRFSRHYFSRILPAVTILFLICPGLVAISAAWPVHGTDSTGVSYDIAQRPRRVVSLVPEITEILIAIDAADALVGITKHTHAPEVADRQRVGSFLSPEIDRIEGLKPDLIFAADFQHEVRDRFQNRCPVLTFNVSSIKGGMERIALLGRIFGREEAAAGVIEKNREQLDRVAQKVAGIPDGKRLRVMRLMGHDSLLVPGDDSFQNDYIRAAGAIAPEFGKNGQAVTITLEEWQRFNPQAVYVCGTGSLPPILFADGVKQVSAVQNNRLYSFSCDLTCRAGVNIGTFVSLLADRLYGEEISGLSPPVPPAKPAGCVMDEK